MSSRRAFLTRSSTCAFFLPAVSGHLFALSQPGNTDDGDHELLERLRQIDSHHPRLHIDRRQADRLRSNVHGQRKKYADSLVRWVERNRNWMPKANQRDSKFSNTVLEEEGAFLTNVALAAVLTDRAEFLNLARQRTLAICTSPLPRFSLYSLGMYVAAMARAYDWLYDEFSDQERATVRAAIEQIASRMYAGSFWGKPGAHWWARYPLHHDYWIPVGGFGEAALALLGECEQAGKWAVGAKQLLDISFGWLGDDGAWHEGVGDWCYAVAPMLMFYGAWQSIVGEDLHDRAWIRNTARYRLYHWLPNDQYVGLNDSFRDGRYGPTGAASCHLLRRLAALFDDGHAQWLADRDERYDLTTGGKGVQRAPHEKLSYREELRDDVHADAYCQAWNLLWYDASVRSAPPTNLPLSHHFQNAGVVIARSGWHDADAAVVSFSCGPLGGQRAAARVRQGDDFVPGNVAHAHADYNAITVFANGEYLVVPPGYARRSSRFQNTVSVNGADGLVHPGLEIRVVAVAAEDGFTYIVGDATRAFPKAAAVALYRRHLWFGEGRLILLDDVQLDDSSGRYWNHFQWTLHSDPRTHRVTADGPRLLWQNRKAKAASMRVTILQPEEFAWEHARLESLDGISMLNAHRLVRPEWYSSRMHVLAELTTDVTQTVPELVRHEKVLAVRTPGTSQAVIAFALAPLDRGDVELAEFANSVGHDLIVFGCDPARPADSIRFSK